jgi:3,4-dihydroxy 2-butanone 4-phosphate synthase/GTP cyclohydrolase II
VERAETARRLADPDAQPGDYICPDHVVPIRVQRDGGERNKTVTAAALTLVQIVGLPPAAVLSPLVSLANPTQMAQTAESMAFAAAHGLAVVDSHTLSPVDPIGWPGAPRATQ